MKAAIYCRLSEEDRNKQNRVDDSASIQNQKSMLAQFAMEQGWIIYDIYSDDDYAGADRNRPEFNRLLLDAQERRFDIVLCKTQSRFTRELELVEHYIHDLFPRLGIRFVSIVDNADTAVKGNKKSRQINGLVNEWYLEDMSENIRSVLTTRRQNGYHIGAFALYGYQKDPKQKGHLIVDEEAARVVREVFTLYVNGMGKTAIARLLNERGVPNPTEYKRLHGMRYQQAKGVQGTLWSYPAISHMLTNEIYIGNMVQGRYGSVSYKTKENRPRPKKDWIRVEHTHAPIIDPELWSRAQSLIEQRAKPLATGTIGIFARKVHCVSCGYAMRSSKSHGKHYLTCGLAHTGGGSCPGAFIPVAELEEIVRNELLKIIDTYLYKEIVIEGLQLPSSAQGRLEKRRAELASCRRKIDGQSKALGLLYLDRAKGSINETVFSSLLENMLKEKKLLQALAADLESCIVDLQAKEALCPSKKSIVEGHLAFKQLDRPAIEKLIDVIYVGKRDKRTKEIPVEIHWNF